MSHKYPRNAVRKAIKAHQPHLHLPTQADALIYLDYLVFMSELCRNARYFASQDGSRDINSTHLLRASDGVLARFRSLNPDEESLDEDTEDENEL
ncbi:hypothetical protein IWQ60_004493 [Tieghemiomyces parasiticus]|uniref:Transcription factor CBF/NF-Y/archaeal histone domain-containing protein n=1 Tax=Tieghemiomyces parasiticus TaxID=78921 RepID=A0A9W8A8S1_9FUNG|nr:hypothetical protein IWQ60_004493 [Tieghemiomyces parasiticus]